MKSKKRSKRLIIIIALLLVSAVVAVLLLFPLFSKKKGNINLPGDLGTDTETEYYTLAFTVNGIIYHSESHAAGEKISLPSDPEVNGYDFISWDSELPSVMPEGDLTLSAVLKAKLYELTFLLDGEALLTSEVEYGSEISAPTPDYDRESHIFSGWTNLPDTMPAGDLTVNGYLYNLEDAISIDLSSLGDGEIYTVSSGGIYIISGVADNAQLLINAPDQNIVFLMMSASITYLGDSAPMSCVKGENLTITLLPGSENLISDTEANLLDGALNVKSADLTINGSGKLNVSSSHEGIYNTKDMTIEGGELSVDAVSHGICVKDSLSIVGGSVKISAGGDAIKCKGDTDSSDIYVEKSGELLIRGGSLDLTSLGDGIDVEYKYTHNSGTIIINAESDGIKSGHSICIGGGELEISAREDGIKASLGSSSNASGSITLAGGNITVTSDLDALQADGDISVAQLVSVSLTAGGGPSGEVLYDENGSELSQKGIKAQKNIKILGGNLTVKSLECSIKSCGDITISGGSVKAESGADTVKNDDTSGNILISGGLLELSALKDGLAAYESLKISGGTVFVTTTGEVAVSGSSQGGFGGMGRPGFSSSAGSSDTYPSSKGIKSDGLLEISGGSINVSSTGHALHSVGATSISGGAAKLASSSGKGIAAHGDISISDSASIYISEATEAIESKASITVDGGSIYLIASDDGFNTGGSVTSSNYTSHRVTVNGGFIYAVGLGDVFDSNGDMSFRGGTTVIIGPADGGNSCLDSQYGISYTGGTVVAVASSSSMWGQDVIGNITGDYVYNTSCGSLAEGGVIAITNGTGEVVCALSSPIYGNIGVLFMSDLVKNIEDCSLILNADYDGNFISCGFAFGGTANSGSEVSLNSGSDAVGGFGGSGMPGGSGKPNGGEKPGGGFHGGGRPKEFS